MPGSGTLYRRTLTSRDNLSIVLLSTGGMERMTTDVAWYYVDRFGQRQGPLTREALQAAIADRSLGPASLVWRAGLAQWQPLSALWAEIEPRNAGMAYGGATAPPVFNASSPIGGEAVNAGFARRFAALILDRLILGGICLVLLVVLAVALAFAGPAREQGAKWLVLGFYPLVFLINLLYSSLLDSSAHQATWGKRAMGIKVATLDGRRIGFGHAVGRWFAKLLSYLTLCIGFLMAAFTSRKQALHDMVASTVVVDRWAYTNQPHRQQRDVSGGAIALIVIACLGVPVVVGILAAIAIPAYQDYVLRTGVAAAIQAAQPLQTQVIENYQQRGQCPVNGADGFLDENGYASKFVSGIHLGHAADSADRCALEITLSSTSTMLNNQHIVLERMSTQGNEWKCTSDVPPKLLPLRCR